MTLFFYDPTIPGNRYYVGVPFDYNGASYSAAGANPQTFTALGFTRVDVDPKPDDRFYVVTGPSLQGTWTTTAKDLTIEKNTWKAATKQQAYELLKTSDWYVLRQVEGAYTDPDSTIPNTIKAYRSAVRSVSNTRCDEIDACINIQELQGVVAGDNPSITEWPEFGDSSVPITDSYYLSS